MVNKCCVKNCKSRYKSHKREYKISFHKFPLNDKDRFQNWCRRISREHFRPSVFSRVCSLHFPDSDFVKESLDKRKSRAKEGELMKKYLKPNAAPSIFHHLTPQRIQYKVPAACPSRSSSISRVEAPLEKMIYGEKISSEDFLHKDEIISLEQFMEKFPSSDNVPSEFTVVHAPDHVIVCTIGDISTVPTITSSITISHDLTVNVSLEGKVIHPMQYQHIIEGTKMSRVSQMLNLIHLIKSWFCNKSSIAIAWIEMAIEPR